MKLKKYLSTVCITTFSVTCTQAAVTYTNDFESGLGGTIIGDGLFGGAGAEDNAAQPGGANGDNWAFFQLGNGGQDAGVVFDLGSTFLTADGTQLNYSFVLGNKVGQTFDETFTLEFYDGDPTGAGTQVGSTITINPVSYDELYAGGAGAEINNISGSLILAGDTTNNLFARFFFDSAKGTFNQGLLDDVSITQTAVPEPSSAALLGLGGLALILRRRK